MVQDFTGPKGRDTSRQLFDDLAFHVVGFLESHSAACSIEVCDRPGVTQASLSSWEQKNRPFKLPEDYKGFLAVSNGVTVRWRLLFRGEEKPFGCMHVNRLEQVRPVPPSDLGNLALAGACISVNAFDLDAECGEGRVALCYRNLTGEVASEDGTVPRWLHQPEVWYQDMSSRWHFVAKSFTDYFRLLASHLGVPQWHYAFTDAGLGPAARQWLAFFCPDRLAIATERSLSSKTVYYYICISLSLSLSIYIYIYMYVIVV